MDKTFNVCKENNECYHKWRRKRKAARLTGTPTRRQIVPDASLFSKLYSSDTDCRQHGRVLTSNLLQKLIGYRVFYVTIADADIESFKSPNAFLNMYFHHMLVKFEQNRMVRTKRNFELLTTEKWLIIFDKALTSFWKTFL